MSKYQETYRGVKIKRRRDKGIKPVRSQRKYPKITDDIVEDHHWYGLQVHSTKELLLQHRMTEMGLMTYVPVRVEYRFQNNIHRKRHKLDPRKYPKIQKSYPEVPGYVFLGFKDEQLTPGNIPHWMKIFDMDLVVGVISNQGEPLKLQKGDIRRLIEIFPKGMRRPKAAMYQRTHAEFKKGDNVRICLGPFEGQEVPVVEIMDEKTRVTLSLFGASREILIDTIDLEKAA